MQPGAEHGRRSFETADHPGAIKVEEEGAADHYSIADLRSGCARNLAPPDENVAWVAQSCGETEIANRIDHRGDDPGH